MKILTLLLFLSLAFTAGAQTPKRDTTVITKEYETRMMRYVKAPPKAEQMNPYAFADSVKTKKSIVKPKKKQGKLTKKPLNRGFVVNGRKLFALWYPVE
jgi:hypothetical protein